MKKIIIFLFAMLMAGICQAQFLKISETPIEGYIPLSTTKGVTEICYSDNDYEVVKIAAKMLSSDIESITGRRPVRVNTPKNAAIVVGTLGKNPVLDKLIKKYSLDTESIAGKWESFIITRVFLNKKTPLLLVIGSDRRGTAYGLMSISEAIGVSPWYWWADVNPQKKNELYIENRYYVQKSPSVQYRGIFINDERFGGWARWAEQTFDKESGKVGPKTYQKVFELLLRLKANYLWPAMHPGTQAFNGDPENARLADDYAIVMGTSHCEQMLRNNEDEWKAVNQRAKERGEKGLGDFNYVTNRATMQKYWEDRVKTNGKYENTYTLGLRGIHDYPMEGANSTEERVAIMQQAINDQRDMLRRNIRRPIEEIPQVLCTYEEVLDAYHNGLKVPDDVTLLWSDDKHGYCRNLCNPDEQKRKGGAGIYYHLSYHGDPASWIWLSPLSPSFLSTELTKAYTFGARKIWVFNVGDIKPAEKEISFVMDLAWNLDKWNPSNAHNYIKYWAEKTFGCAVAQDIAYLMERYYKLQAGGKDAHVWFVDYDEEELAARLREARSLSIEAELLAERIPERLQNAYFELISYPIKGAAMLNEYTLLARRSMANGTFGDSLGAMADAARVQKMFNELNNWTNHYNNEILGGKWQNFFNWQPYHWFRSEKIDPPICTPDLFVKTKKALSPRFVNVDSALSAVGATIVSDVDCEIPLWIKAVSPVRNFSKEKADNVFCSVDFGGNVFEASATPINNIWHSPIIGPMWSNVGTLRIKKGVNTLKINNLKTNARIDGIFIGLWHPFKCRPNQRIAAKNFSGLHEVDDSKIEVVKGLGYNDGVVVQPFDTPSYEVSAAPYVEYDIDINPNNKEIEIRTLPTLHVYEGRGARYAVQLGGGKVQEFSIHEGDFTSEWRLNVLRGYATRTIKIPDGLQGRTKLRIYLLDPGIVLEEILVK